MGLPLSVYRLLLLEDDVNLNLNENENDDSTGSSQVNDKLRRKAERICPFVMEVGNLSSSTSVTTRQSSSELGSVLAVPSVRA